MNFRRAPFPRFLQAAVLAAALLAHSALAQAAPEPDADVRHESVASRYTEGMHKLLDSALGLVGIRYRRGGSSAESGFDCSGFVGFVFLEQFGLKLPRTSYEIAKEGEQVQRADLKPGDLVFFNTMRRAFSHVGIYLGNGEFVHAPRTGKKVRVESMEESYWAKRYNGARRVSE